MSLYLIQQNYDVILLKFINYDVILHKSIN